MKLYELDEKILEIEEKLEAHLIENEGELTDFNLDNQLQSLQIERDRKLLGIGCWIKNMEAEAEAIKAEESKLSQRRKALENKAENVKTWLSMNHKQGEKLKDSRCVLGWRKSKYIACTLDDPIEQTPDEYIKTSYKVMTKEIKEALNSGKEIAGYEVKERLNLQIK